MLNQNVTLSRRFFDELEAFLVSHNKNHKLTDALMLKPSAIKLMRTNDRRLRFHQPRHSTGLIDVPVNLLQHYVACLVHLLQHESNLSRQLRSKLETIFRSTPSRLRNLVVGMGIVYDDYHVRVNGNYIEYITLYSPPVSSYHMTIIVPGFFAGRDSKPLKHAFSIKNVEELDQQVFIPGDNCRDLERFYYVMVNTLRHAKETSIGRADIEVIGLPMPTMNIAPGEQIGHIRIALKKYTRQCYWSHVALEVLDEYELALGRTAEQIISGVA